MELDKNPQKIKSMFDEISPYYDVVNNIMSLGSHYLVKFLAIRELGIKPRSNILDLCCGTGDFVNIINKFYPRAKVIGLDFSNQMIKQAREKNKKGVFIQGDCTNLPFKEREFNYVTIGFGFRNIENRQKVLDEIYRVLNNGGKFLHLDFGYHNVSSRIFDYFALMVGKFFAKNSEHYKYLVESKRNFPEPNDLVKEFENRSFKIIKIKNYLFGVISAQIMEKI